MFGTKMYRPKSYIKCGFKLWCRVGISGYIYGIEVYLEHSSKGPKNICKMKTNKDGVITDGRRFGSREEASLVTASQVQN